VTDKPQPAVLLCPDFYFGSLDKSMANGVRDLARRVALACAKHGVGDDLLAYVYCAGLHHGSEAVAIIKLPEDKP
jgi:hypothetical protein